MDEGVLRCGAWWVGRKFLSLAEFRNQYGVYPNTVSHIVHQVDTSIDVTWLLKTLWWLKQYPTEETIKNQGSSPSHFRKVLWGHLSLLRSKLPEVSTGTRCGVFALDAEISVSNLRARRSPRKRSYRSTYVGSSTGHTRHSRTCAPSFWTRPR